MKHDPLSSSNTGVEFRQTREQNQMVRVENEKKIGNCNRTESESSIVIE